MEKIKKLSITRTIGRFYNVLALNCGADLTLQLVKVHIFIYFKNNTSSASHQISQL